MSALLIDFRFAVRALAKAPGFTAAALFTLALGMVFFLTASVVTRAYLLRDLPYPAGERLYWLRYGDPDHPGPRDMDRLDWRALADVVEHPIAWDLDAFYLLGGDHTEAVVGTWATRGFLDGLGVRPAIGRGLSDSAFEPGGHNDVIISHRLWHARFGGRPDVIGRQFEAYVSDRSEETERFTVVGVLPADFWHLNPYTDILAPLRAPTYPYMVRAREGVTPETLRQRVTALVAAGARDVPADWSVGVEHVHETYVRQIRPAMHAALAAGLLVLLVACANVAGLFLVRAERRRPEVAIRLSLGAGRIAIARLLIVEAMIIASAATAVALIVAAFGLDAMAPALELQIGRRVPGGDGALALDRTMVAYAAAAGLITAVGCAVVPLAAFMRRGGAGIAAGRSRTSTDGRASSRFRSGLIAAEIAVSLTLLSGAALMLRSMQALAGMDLGMTTEHVLSGALTLRQSRYPEAPARAGAFEALMRRMSTVPRVESVALTSMWPLQQPQQRRARLAPGRESLVPVQAISEGYFETLGIPIRSGRAFSPTDRAGSEPVVIVSETLASRLWHGDTPLGARLLMPPPDEDAEPRPYVVVGIAADVRQGAHDDNPADAYVPIMQEPGRSAFVLLRTAGGDAHVLRQTRAAIRDVDPEIALDRTLPLETIADRTTAGTRTLATALSVFAFAAVALALVGIYGAVAYAVRQREREIAVRVAVGADPARIVRLFVREGAVLVLAGVTLGTAAAIAAGRTIQSQLFGVTAADPLALGAAATAFAAAALAATWWPARRAATTDPAIALRVE